MENSKKKLTGIECLKEYRKNKKKHLPMIDHEKQHFDRSNEYGDVNIGWNCGSIDNRPYFYECWATEGITMLTIFISAEGIEDSKEKNIENMIINDAKIYKKKKGYKKPEIQKFVDKKGNEFYSINILVGVEDEPAVIDGAPLLSFEVLNDFNKKNRK